MSRTIAWASIGALALAAGAGVAARPQTPGTGFTTSTTAVVVDVVVRDGKGAPILDLKPSDFELLEDDVRQRITSVELIAPGRARPTRATGAAPAPSSGRTPGSTPGVTPGSTAGTPEPAKGPTKAATEGATEGPTEGPTVIALAFHRLSADGRALAYRAARSYVDGTIGPNDYAGVFVVDTRLETLQTFTTDRKKIAAGVDRAARTPTSTFTRHQPMASVYGDASPDVSPTAGAESVGRPLGESGFVPRTRRSDLPPGAAVASRLLLELAERMENAYEEMMRDRNGHAESAALTALASAMGALPGRKTIVFFSEGLSVPAAVAAKFRAVIDTANRGNVSIYAVDAKGLKVHSEQAATARGLAALRGVGDDDPDKVREDDTRRARITDLERNEFLLKKDPAVSLGTLAKETGGFLIDNTNDLAAAFQRIEADRRFHYLLTYTPANPALDGAFRRIAVKVKRRGVDVRARSGYVAVPALGAVPVLRFESNALSALAATPRPTNVPLRAAIFQFPEADGSTRVTLFVQAPGSSVAYFVDDKQTAYQTHFTILARVLDAQGEVVRKGSQPYRLTGPAKDVHVARQGNVLFYRQPTLGAGAYTFDYALYDELSGQAGTGALAVDIAPREAKALAMSSIVLVDHAEAVPADQTDASNPLYLGATLVYPNLGTPIVRSRRGSLVFYYTARAGGRPMTGRVELVQGGQAIATRALAVPGADATGLAQHANELPIEDVGAGAYELRVTLSDGASTITRSAAFVLTP